MFELFEFILGVVLVGSLVFAALDILYEKTGWRVFELLSFPFMFFCGALIFLFPFALALGIISLLILIF